MLLLEARQISKSYQDSDQRLKVLTKLDFCAEKGETIALTGESGCGKSTLLHILGLLDKPDAGEILYWGKPAPTKDKKIANFRNAKLGFVFQFHYLLDDFNALENIAMPMFLACKDMTKSKKAALQLMKDVDIYDRRNHYPNQLSGGEQQRVALARAFINQPDIIFADEPAGNLDPRHASEIIDLFLHMNKLYEQTSVLVTHNAEIAARMQTRYLLQNQQIKKLV